MTDLKRLVFSEVADPMSDAYALTDADKAAVEPRHVGPWFIAGDWRWRGLGREVQLRNKRLPHLTLDLFRTEAEALYAALGNILSQPAPMPYRTPWHERLRMWWLRAVWNRKHARELDEHRAAMLKEFAERSPWG